MFIMQLDDSRTGIAGITVVCVIGPVTASPKICDVMNMVTTRLSPITSLKGSDGDMCDLIRHQLNTK